jgi:hypothetical protein
VSYTARQKNYRLNSDSKFPGQVLQRCKGWRRTLSLLNVNIDLIFLALLHQRSCVRSGLWCSHCRCHDIPFVAKQKWLPEVAPFLYIFSRIILISCANLGRTRQYISSPRTHWTVAHWRVCSQFATLWQ